MGVTLGGCAAGAHFCVDRIDRHGLDRHEQIAPGRNRVGLGNINQRIGLTDGLRLGVSNGFHERPFENGRVRCTCHSLLDKHIA